jgi:hypothetical protein
MKWSLSFWPTKARLYPAEEIAGMSAEEAVVVAFLRFRLGGLADRAAA